MVRAWLTGILRTLSHLATTALFMVAVLWLRIAETGSLAGPVVAIGIIGVALRDLARAAELAVPGRVSRRRIAALLSLPRQGRSRPSRWRRGETRQLVLDALVLRVNHAAISTTLDAGEVIRILGEPALRQTLFTTLAGLHGPHSGTVRWNGSDVTARRPEQRRRLVGLASRDLPMLGGSDGFNLRYRRPDLPDEQVQALARAWSIDPARRDTPQERLSLTRALLGQPPTLLLAPQDASLDDADGALLGEAIGGWPGVVLLASNHPLLVRLATRCWTLDAGGLHDRPPAPNMYRLDAPERAA